MHRERKPSWASGLFILDCHSIIMNCIKVETKEKFQIKIGLETKLDLIKPGYYQQIIRFLKQLLGSFSVTISK